VPQRAAEALLRNFRPQAVATCILAPSHAAQIERALAMLPAEQALLVIQPDVQRVYMDLHCCDFSADIHGRRLWFAAGAGWAQELARIFVDNPGLPTPQQFIRTALVSEESAGEMMTVAQRVFAAEAQRRMALIQELRGRARKVGGKIGRLCIIAPSRFRLWNDAGRVLGEMIGEQAKTQGVRDTKGEVPAPSSGTPGEGWGGGGIGDDRSRTDGSTPTLTLPRSTGGGDASLPPKLSHPHAQGVECVRFDSDDPAGSSPLALAAAGADCDAMLAANIGRSEVGAVVNEELPLITWVTTPRIPAYAAAGPHDALLLADEQWVSRAHAAGWPENRLVVARWPGRVLAAQPDRPGHLAIIADTLDVYAPRTFELSSHGLLWEMIRGELVKNPFALGHDVLAYLKYRMQRTGIQQQGLNWDSFIDELIVPAWQQGIARVILAAGLPLRLHGLGWGNLADLSHCAAGPVVNRCGLESAACAATALVHLWPLASAHAMDGLGRPVIRANHGANCLLNECRRALAGEGRMEPLPGELSVDAIINVIRVATMKRHGS
jgi:hypothetical protein